MIIHVIADKDDAMHGMTSLVHLPFYLPASIDKATQNNCVNHIDPLCAPPLIKVVE
jgi:hypothetical protein